MGSISFADVITQFDAFTNSDVVKGGVTWIIGIAIGAFFLRQLLHALGR
jgi:hypothetical protein